MAKVDLAEHMRERRTEATSDIPQKCGPFVTISRQFGCQGFSLGLLLLEILNDEVEVGHAWKIYHREILSTLATETDMAEDLLEKERLAKPKFLASLFQSLRKQRGPSGLEIRNRVTTIIRGLAIGGHAILIGQGGAGATSDLPNGLSVRLEAPQEWRSKQIAFREGLSETEAKLRIQAMEQDREYLRKIYETRFPRKPAFHVVYDVSVFTLAQIARQIVLAMKLKGVKTPQ